MNVQTRTGKRVAMPFETVRYRFPGNQQEGARRDQEVYVDMHAETLETMANELETDTNLPFLVAFRQ